MKVLLVSNMYPDANNPSYGVFVKKFADELDKMNIQWNKAVMFKKDGKIRKVCEYVKFYSKAFFQAIFGKYDVIYIHYASHSSAPILAASIFRRLRIYTNVHGSDIVPENNVQKYMQRYTKRILKKSEKIIIPSQYFKDYVKEKYGVKESTFYIYPSAGVDTKLFHQMSNEEIEKERKKLIDNTSTLIFGMAGRISAGKGWDVFIKAIRIAKDKGIKCKYVIVGSGPEENKMDELIEKYDLKEDIRRIKLLPQEELCKIYNAIDYFVFPTKREGESLGLVALEAMSCGTPVIASNFAAPKYYIENDVNVYLFTVDDPFALAERISFCTQNRPKMKEGVAQTAYRYSNDNIRQELVKIFDLEKLG